MLLQSDAEEYAAQTRTVPKMRFDFEGHSIEITTPTRAKLQQTVSQHLSARRGFALATLNLDHLVKLRCDPSFRSAYARQDIVVADGNPIVWLSRLANRPVDLLPGSELIAPLAQLAAEQGIPVALFGSNAEVLEMAAEVLQARYPGLELAARIAPPMGFDPTGPTAKRLLDDLSESGAGLCFVALGAPKQEEFAAFGREHAPQIGFVSIGAGLDFLAGHQTRAPRLMRFLALEWLWRMVLSPQRLALRYLRCFAILPRQVVMAWRLRHAAR